MKNTICKWINPLKVTVVLLGGILAVHVSGLMATPTGQQEQADYSIDQQKRGAYLARAGNCQGCHTVSGGQSYAGGRELSTSFGVFVTPNITPDRTTGIGNWSEEDFWQALHYGKSRDGRLLYPAFPYTEYTRVTRQDANAIFAYLQSLAPVKQANAPHKVDFPYNFRPLLSIWRALYFKRGVYVPVVNRDEQWNRGAYLVQGLGHCNACHTRRGFLGASDDDALSGGQIMGMNWYAPSLSSHLRADGGDWTVDEIAQLLSAGISERAVASGPMATIVRQSLQHLSDKDIRAMAVYLKDRTGKRNDETSATEVQIKPERKGALLSQGEAIYSRYCQECHGAAGEGAPGIYPPLRDNGSVVMASSMNLIRIVLEGGYPATTKVNPQPYGMPPFQHILNNEEIALVATYIRNAWGNRASVVTPGNVDRLRGSQRH